METNVEDIAFPSHTVAQERRRLSAAAAILTVLAGFAIVVHQTNYRGSHDIHAMFEILGSLFGIIAGLAIALRFYTLGSRFHMIVGLAFFINGAEDFVHGLLATACDHAWIGVTPASLERFIPCTYVTGRILMAMILLAAPFGNRLLGVSRNPRREGPLVWTIVIILSGALTALAFRVPLPQFIYDGQLISRPFDFASGVLLLAGLVMFMGLYHRQKDSLIWWITLSIGINMIGQFSMGFSHTISDASSDVAHAYKVLGYIAPMLGFTLYQIGIAESSLRSGRLLRLAKDELEASNEALEARVAECSRAEAVLRESQKRFSQVAENSGEWIWEVDARGLYTYSSPAVEAILGYEPSEVVGRKYFYDFFAPQERDRLLRSANEMMAAKSALKSWLNLNVHRNGKLVLLETSGVPMLDDNGSVIGYRGVDVDVTDRKKAEKELRRSRELLEHRFRERTCELEEANRRLRQAQLDMVQKEKMSMLGQLAAGVAHEMNTPLGAILNVMSDAAEHLKGFVATGPAVLQLPPQVRQWCIESCLRMVTEGPLQSGSARRSLRDEVEKEIAKCGFKDPRRVSAVIVDGFGRNWREVPNLLENLAIGAVFDALDHMQSLKSTMDISTVSARKVARIIRALKYYSYSNPDEVSWVSISESIDNTLTILQNRIKPVAEVRTAFAKDLPQISCGGDISQVWTNILSNACDAIEESGKGELGLIEIRTFMADKELTVEIYNKGPCIPENVLPRIFEAFFTTKSVGKGTGLGLSICHSILRRYGGTISATNQPDGVTFKVCLPVPDQAQINQDTKPDSVRKAQEMPQPTAK